VGESLDVVGAWSDVVGDLRGRLVTSTSRPDRSALRVCLDLENLGATPLEIHWSGKTRLGFVTFRLDDQAGVEVPEPDWSFGGNEYIGDCYAVVPAGAVRFEVAANLFEEFCGRRVVRIGTFWAREMPSDGSRRFLCAQVTGERARRADHMASGDGRSLPPGDARSTLRGRAWKASLDVPGVCIH
jgi:hypothetical protein